MIVAWHSSLFGVLRLFGAILQLLSASLRPRAALAVENLFLSLGPGIPDPPKTTLAAQQRPRHRFNANGVQARAILGGLHHEYTVLSNNRDGPATR